MAMPVDWRALRLLYRQLSIAHGACIPAMLPAVMQ